MTADSTERVRHPDGRSFTLRADAHALRITKNKGCAMVDVVDPVPLTSPEDLGSARALILSRLAELPPVAPEIPESRCEVAPVLSFAESIEFARDCLQRAEAMEAEARELRDEARRVVQRAMSS